MTAPQSTAVEPADTIRVPRFARGLGTRTFSSLRHRDWRLLWFGWLFTNTGDWMDQLALNWLILDLTRSPLYLGLVNLARAIPVLIFTLVGGVAADRMDRRRVLVVSQCVGGILAVLLGTLIVTGVLELWEIFVIAIFRGIAFSFNMPARQTLIPAVVPRDDLQNAVSLNSLALNLTRIIGPTIAGVLIASIGVAGCFFVNGLSFLPTIWMLLLTNIPKRVSTEGGNAVRMATEAFVYIRRDSTLLLLVIAATVPLFFGMPYLTMITVFARDVLQAGPQGLGVLTGAASFGAVAGSLTLATLGDFRKKGLVMLLAMIVFSGLLIAYSWSQSFILSALLLVGAGSMMNVYNSTNNTVLHLTAPDHLRGRIMSVVLLNRGIVPLGTSAFGALAAQFGAPVAQSSMAAVVLVMSVVMLATGSGLRRLE